MPAHPEPRETAAPRDRRCSSRGFVLPFVLIAITAASMLAFALTAEGLQGVRGQRAAAHGADAAGAADAALAQALATYPDDSVWMAPLGVPRTNTVEVNGIAVAVQWQRHQPLVASLRALSRTTGGRLDAAEREHVRAVWLAPPPVPVVAALASNGAITGREGTLISGGDLVVPDSPCGPMRDTSSVAAVVAPEIRGDVSGSWPGVPVAVPVPTDFLHNVRAALGVIGARLPETVVGVTARAFPASRSWAPLQWRGDTVRLAGATRWSGLVVVHGHLVVTGSVHVTGLLLVDGALDASAADLTVQGAVLVADTSASGVMLGARSHLFYDRCSVQMALASVARPSLAPFSLWHSLPR